MESNSRRQIRLGDYCQKIGSGATPRGGSDVYLSKGDFALIRSQNVYNNRFEWDGLAFISESHAEELKGVEVKAGDVLLNITGDSVARACLVPPTILPARVNQHVSIIRTNYGELDARYLLYCLVSPSMQRHLLTLASAGATRNALTKGMIEDLRIEVPSIEEQRAIAHVLGTLDEKIEINFRLNAALEKFAQTLFRSWFIDFDAVRAKSDGQMPDGLEPDGANLFPDSFDTTGIGMIPKGWKVGDLSLVSSNVRRGVNPREADPETDYIGLEHMPRRSIALYDHGVAADVDSGKLLYKEGEILFGKLRPYFHKVGIAVSDGVCSTDILVIKPHNPWLSFVLGHTSSQGLIDHATACSDGTRMPRTSWNDLTKYQVALPPEPVARAYERQVQPLLAQIRTNILESRKLEEIRNSLLPKLISGKVLLPEEMIAQFELPK